MDFQAGLQELGDRIRQSKGQVQTEEATKNAFVLPFLRLLGYDVFNPNEVVPEYTADIGIKKGERVDYAVLRDGEPVMLFECKSCTAELDAGKCSQLYRYFQTLPSARIGVLTNGLKYQFFTDLDARHLMDQRPFMEFDVLSPDQTLVAELLKLSKPQWDIDATLSAATELKYTRALKVVLVKEFQDPSEDFVRHLANKVYDGALTAKVREMFTGIVRRAFQSLIKDMINDRLASAMIEPPQPPAERKPAEGEAASPSDPKIVTTEEELEGFYAVKSILRQKIDAKRITIRDTQSYCGVLLDDNNRKPICRLHFNGKQKYLGLFDAGKKEERIPIASVDDIYAFADRLAEPVSHYCEADAQDAQ